MKKILVILALIGVLSFLFSGCNLTTPGVNNGTEGEDEGEEDSRVVMVELFVAPACGNCPKAKQYMAQLLEEYGTDKLVVLEEYAWNYPLNSGWATSETINRYKWYTSDGGTPDAYFNGLNQNIKRYNSSYNNYKNAIDKELAKSPKITIFASASKDESIHSIGINGNIDNISSETLENLVIGAMVYEDSVLLGSSTVNHVVRDIITSELISSLFSGSTYSFSLYADAEDLKWADNFSNLHIIVYVQSPYSSAKEIIQALYIE